MKKNALEGTMIPWKMGAHAPLDKLALELGYFPEQSNKLLKRLETTFKAQQHQAGLVANHVAKSPYKVLLCGDFNNTVYSYVYRILKGDLKDSRKDRWGSRPKIARENPVVTKRR